MSNNTFRHDDEHARRRRTRKNIWLSIGAAVLILVLLWWLFVAITSGDTDVAAFIPPIVNY